jgi:adenine-specific DNA-methyltransferase
MARGRKRTPNEGKAIEAFTHEEATRRNIPTAEFQSVMEKAEQSPIRVAYERRNRDLDPQLVWRGKDEQDWSDLVTYAPPLYIQEKVHPKVLIDDLRRRSEAEAKAADPQADLFAEFNGLIDENARTEFYRHEANWSNRLILGDSLQVMASLAEREGLRGKVQCIYIDPPYGIKFNSNFQWSTTSRDVKDGNVEHITREPEQVKAFRDTWRDGVHSYLTYLRDRLTAARDLLHESGSIFVQIGDENVHRVRALMDEVFGEETFCSLITFRKTTGTGSGLLDNTVDFILWYAKDKASVKYRALFEERNPREEVNLRYIQTSDGLRRSMMRDELAGSAPLPPQSRIYRPNPLTSARVVQGSDLREFYFQGKRFAPGAGTFKTNERGLVQLLRADRLLAIGRSLTFLRFLDDFPVKPRNNVWDDTRTGGFGDDRLYVVQTVAKVVARCLLMTTDPGDLVLDPTCGSGTTAYVAEQWGRRWITIDTSRVALALARARIMGARYPYYLLADSPEGQAREAEVTRSEPSTAPTHGGIRQGFVYERVPHVTLKSIANNAEIDVIWEKYQETLEPLRQQLNKALGKTWEEWEIPREPEEKWPGRAKEAHAAWWEQRIARQKEIDASIASKAEFEYLYDKPYEERRTVRVAGPFTVESLSPHRVLGVDEHDELIDPQKAGAGINGDEQGFVPMILENLRTAGVQQARKDDKISFTSLTPWPGHWVCAEGRYVEGGTDGDSAAGREKRAAIFVGPEFGTVSRPDLVAAAREAGDADFDVLVACAFNYDAHSSEFDKLGRIPVLKARMNADLHMADDLKNTGKGNLFVIFGEPSIQILAAEEGQIQVKVEGVDVFDPSTGEIRSDDPDGIACWFIDTDYNEESFFVRHAYFLGANDPYKALKTTLRAEINEEAWATLHSDTSRPFAKPTSGRIAVKVINHLGDEVMKVFRVE